jgi:hypothetical protein
VTQKEKNAKSKKNSYLNLPDNSKSGGYILTENKKGSGIGLIGWIGIIIVVFIALMIILNL